ncbi:DMT family transporter [Jeotgalibacillus sp. R-1-5s-1]|uniref:DMT family transporter n=1 Tax=Jeotgalibacillus sp. R-1-5s-1 TaxID=2555897 RepID=UPI00106CAA03|nr:DMT family transporter [Jeotgalibacillus sp. R-1-5s-1]TFE00134.1 DMT family transporter [Jeotgalibacillus sp. R-1-5s-1]
MKGILFALAGGFFLTFQSVANATIGQQIGTWQAAAMTQFTGFVLAVIIVLTMRDKTWKDLGQVPKLYASGGAFAAIVLFSNMTSVYLMGVTLTISLFLIAQLVVAVIIDRFGLFDMSQKQISKTQMLGLLLMVAGVVVLKG